LKKSLYIWLLSLLSLTAFAQTPDRSADDFVHAGVIVAQPGSVLYSTIGHAALHMQCPAYGLDYVFSYEGEDVSHQFLTFLRGKLRMGMFAVPADMFLEGYSRDGRGVWEYPLQLTPGQKQELWRALDKRTAAGADLPYDYFHRGCAITIVDILHEALGDTPICYAPWPDKYTRLSRRELVRDAITDAPWNEWALYLLIGAIGDRPCSPEEKLIVPQDLASVWQQAAVSGRPLLGQPVELVPPSDAVRTCGVTPMMVGTALLVLAVLSLLLSLWGKRVASRIAGWCVVVPAWALGVVLTYLVCCSSLPCTEWNWLLLPFNVLPLLAWRWRRFWALPYAGAVVLWCIFMAAWPHTLVDPSQIVFAAAYALALAAFSK